MQQATLTTPLTLPALADGEHYAGILVGLDGAHSHHLILLPGEAEAVTWQQARDWAVQADGELPTRREQALLYANCQAQFRPSWYWSDEQHASDAGYAWYQYFYYGFQGHNHKNNQLRARAVRRLPI